MSTDAINNVIQNSGIGTGNFLIHYDFSEYTGQKIVPASGNQYNYSGTITLSPDNAATYTAMTGTLGEVTLSGGFNSTHQYITVDDSQTIYPNGFLDSQSFTYVFQTEHLTQFDIGNSVQKPLNKKDVVFSNLTGDTINCISGWEFGLNSANKLYFKKNDQQQPSSFSFGGETFGSNIWAVRYYNPTVSISRFDPFDNTIETESFRFYEPVSNGGPWTIGSGRAMQAVDSSISDGITSAIKLNNFMFFDQYLSDNNVQNLCYGILGQKTTSNDSQTFYSSGVSGSSLNGSGVSGLLWESGVLSGYITESTGTVTIQRAIELSGLVTNGQAYFDRLQQISGATSAYLNEPEWIYQTLLNTGSSFSGITGLDYVSQTITLSGQVPVYITSGISGILTTGYSSSISYTGTGITVSSSSYSISSLNKQSVFPKSLSYIGQRNSGDFIEIISGITSYSGSQIINKDAVKSISSTANQKTLFTDASYPTGQINMFINGVAYRVGQVSVETTNESQILSTTTDGQVITISCDGVTVSEVSSTSTQAVSAGRITEISISKDYGFTGFREMVFPYDFSSESDQENLFGVYDVYQGESSDRQELVISSTGQYTGAPFSEINPSGKQVFFNGQKIYPSINYVANATTLTPSGYITGVTGIYYTMPQYIGQIQWTGENQSQNTDIYNNYNGYFYPKSNVVYVNGIRKPLSQFIEHDISRDLITGVTISEDGLTNLLDTSF